MLKVESSALAPDPARGATGARSPLLYISPLPRGLRGCQGRDRLVVFFTQR
jgi:hypothetical protein